jgi:hypothetical protein
VQDVGEPGRAHPPLLSDPQPLIVADALGPLSFHLAEVLVDRCGGLRAVLDLSDLVSIASHRQLLGSVVDVTLNDFPARARRS